MLTDELGVGDLICLGGRPYVVLSQLAAMLEPPRSVCYTVYGASGIHTCYVAWHKTGTGDLEGRLWTSNEACVGFISTWSRLTIIGGCQ